MNTNPLQATLLPCPFCGGTAQIESNRDWHKLIGEHDDDCIFDEADEMMTVPATGDNLLWLIAAWNRRVSQVAGEPVEPVAQEFRIAPYPMPDSLRHVEYEYMGKPLPASVMAGVYHAFVRNLPASPQPAAQKVKQKHVETLDDIDDDGDASWFHDPDMGAR